MGNNDLHTDKWLGIQEPFSEDGMMSYYLMLMVLTSMVMITMQETSLSGATEFTLHTISFCWQLTGVSIVIVIVIVMMIVVGVDQVEDV